MSSQKETTKVIEIEIGKPSETEIPSAPIIPMISEPQIQHEIIPERMKGPETIATVRPPPIHPEFTAILTEQPEFMGPPTFEPDSDVSTAKLWKKRDGRPLDQQDKITVKLGLLTEITDYLRVNEPKKTYSEQSTIIRRKRMQQPSLSTQQTDGDMKAISIIKKRNEKKPRKDCVCALEKVENEKRNKLLLFVNGLVKLNDEEKIDDIFQFAQSIIPGLNIDEQMEEEEQQMIQHENGEHVE